MGLLHLNVGYFDCFFLIRANGSICGFFAEFDGSFNVDSWPFLQVTFYAILFKSYRISYLFFYIFIVSTTKKKLKLNNHLVMINTIVL